MAHLMMYEDTGGIVLQATKIPSSNHYCCCLCLMKYSANILISAAVTEDLLNSVNHFTLLFCFSFVVCRNSSICFCL